MTEIILNKLYLYVLNIYRCVYMYVGTYIPFCYTYFLSFFLLLEKILYFVVTVKLLFVTISFFILTILEKNDRDIRNRRI